LDSNVISSCENPTDFDKFHISNGISWLYGQSDKIKKAKSKMTQINHMISWKEIWPILIKNQLKISKELYLYLKAIF